MTPSRWRRCPPPTSSLGRSRPDVINALADDALDCATAAADEWQIASAYEAKARGARTAVELRDRVDRAVSLLESVGNVYARAVLLVTAEYAALCNGDDRDAKDFVDRAGPVIREVDSPYLSLVQHGNLGLVSLFTGDTDIATDALGEELKLCRELVHRPGASEGLRGLAAVAAIHGDDHRAACLAGAAAAHLYGHPEDAVAERLHAQFLACARTRHGPDRWDAAARVGSALGFDQAIAFALQEPRV